MHLRFITRAGMIICRMCVCVCGCLSGPHLQVGRVHSELHEGVHALRGGLNSFRLSAQPSRDASSGYTLSFFLLPPLRRQRRRQSHLPESVSIARAQVLDVARCHLGGPACVRVRLPPPPHQGRYRREARVVVELMHAQLGAVQVHYELRV
jgi:hypothetical protein